MNQKEAAFYRGVLEGSVVFKGLQATVVEQILRQGLILEAKKGDLVSFENMPGGIGLYVVLEGKVEVFRAKPPDGVMPTHGQVHLNTLMPGHCFGEYSLLDGKATSASAMTLESSRLFFLPRGEFLKLSDSNHEAGKIIYRNLLLFLILRLRQKDEELNARR
ncbi:MAG: Crp/Fnr family transcriptional regulator [Nevskiales bacterium]